jgi:hypothetical protein
MYELMLGCSGLIGRLTSTPWASLVTLVNDDMSSRVADMAHHVGSLLVSLGMVPWRADRALVVVWARLRNERSTERCVGGGAGRSSPGRGLRVCFWTVDCIGQLVHTVFWRQMVRWASRVDRSMWPTSTQGPELVAARGQDPACALPNLENLVGDDGVGAGDLTAPAPAVRDPLHSTLVHLRDDGSPAGSLGSPAGQPSNPGRCGRAGYLPHEPVSTWDATRSMGGNQRTRGLSAGLIRTDGVLRERMHIYGTICNLCIG